LSLTAPTAVREKRERKRKAVAPAQKTNRHRRAKAQSARAVGSGKDRHADSKGAVSAQISKGFTRYSRPPSCISQTAKTHQPGPLSSEIIEIRYHLISHKKF